MFEKLARKVQGVRRVRKDEEDKGKVENGGAVKMWESLKAERERLMLNEELSGERV
jgi:hypothetical protein